jgi:Ser/Thr protein kinase RdoA (MazF antagonist)
MSDRIQFNVRLDKYPELHEAIKGMAEEQGLTLNEFAIRAFHQALGWEVEHRSPVLRAELEEMLAGILAPMQQRLEELEQRLGESRA